MRDQPRSKSAGMRVMMTDCRKYGLRRHKSGADFSQALPKRVLAPG
jgi:hypothetical protein